MQRMQKGFLVRLYRLLLFLSAMAFRGTALAQEDPVDPLEPLNRVVYAFNETVDRVALRPIAQVYRTVTPTFVQMGVRNFFSNLGDVSVVVNDLLQLKIEQAANDFMRVAFNSTFGLLGVLDVASEMGLKKHTEDFGQTLGRWGVGTGPYLVLPFFGPSNFRDAIGMLVDMNYTDPVWYTDDIGVRNRAVILRLISRRSDFLGAKAAVDMAALDGYEYTRDFYLERRRVLVYDGRPPRVDE